MKKKVWLVICIICVFCMLSGCEFFPEMSYEQIEESYIAFKDHFKETSLPDGYYIDIFKTDEESYYDFYGYGIDDDKIFSEETDDFLTIINNGNIKARDLYQGKVYTRSIMSLKFNADSIVSEAKSVIQKLVSSDIPCKKEEDYAYIGHILCSYKDEDIKNLNIFDKETKDITVSYCPNSRNTAFSNVELCYIQDGYEYSVRFMRKADDCDLIEIEQMKENFEKMAD